MFKTTCRVLTCLTLFFSMPTWAADHGLFMVVKGSVKVLSGKDKKESVAKVGSKVFSGDTVITEKDSRAKIVMADRNVLQLSPDSKLEITKYKTGATESDREVQVALNNGKVRVEVEQKYSEKNKFELRTPTAVAGVRGTKYVAQYNAATSASTFMVLSGTVAVGRPGGGTPVLLTANMMSTVTANSAPTEARKMSTQERQDAQSDTNPAAPSNENGGGTNPPPAGGTGATSSDTSSSNSESKSPAGPSSSENSSTNSGTGKASSSNSSEGGSKPPSMVSSDLMSPNVKQEVSPAFPAAPSVNVPPVVAQPPAVPKPPVQPQVINDIIQNKNSKTKVIVTPKPQ